MFSAISAELARDREIELRQIDRRGRLAGLLRFGRTKAPAPVEPEVTIRVAGPADDEALARLAELSDSRPAPVGYVLVAEVGGELRAAVSVAGGGTVADPFHPTAALTSLLALRVSQLRGSELEPFAPARRPDL